MRTWLPAPQVDRCRSHSTTPPSQPWWRANALTVHRWLNREWAMLHNAPACSCDHAKFNSSSSRAPLQATRSVQRQCPAACPPETACAAHTYQSRRGATKLLKLSAWSTASRGMTPTSPSVMARSVMMSRSPAMPRPTPAMEAVLGLRIKACTGPTKMVKIRPATAEAPNPTMRSEYSMRSSGVSPSMRIDDWVHENREAGAGVTNTGVRTAASSGR
mmetsp:Transcript_19113/g.51404  ORF Transcript_19113/g.51404 Transcript_19113/m.51404 type:complete len:217 (+) Transcript_19113:105-755(+)